MAPQYTTTTVSSTVASFAPSVTSNEVIPSATATVDSTAMKVLKAIPPWAYVFIIIGILLLANLTFFTMAKCWIAVRRLWKERKEAGMWKEVKEGRREQLMETYKKLEGKGGQGKKDKEGSMEKNESWEEIDLNESGTTSQSKDWKNYILERIKALDSNVNGGISPPEVTMPKKALLKEHWVLDIPPGLHT